MKYSISGRIGLYRDHEGIAMKNEYSLNFSQLNDQYANYSEDMWKRAIAIMDSTDSIKMKQWEK